MLKFIEFPKQAYRASNKECYIHVFLTSQLVMNNKTIYSILKHICYMHINYSRKKQTIYVCYLLTYVLFPYAT